MLLKPRPLWMLSLLTLILTGFCLVFVLPDNFVILGYQNGTGDLSQHLSGWYAFAQEPWHFPLLKITSLNYPLGASASQMDSIPLFAVLFKLIYRFLPTDFNYFAIFVIFVYLFQGFSALTLAYALRKNNLLVTIILISFALTAPILSYRVGTEDSLSCQGFILMGIAGYFFVYFNNLRLIGCNVFFGILIATSLLIHPYLTAMFYPFYLISLIKIKHQDNIRYRGMYKPILIMHACIALEYVILGLGQTTNVCGFGFFTMNLLAPIYGGWFTHYHTLLGYPAQGEGFAYLGMGLILMVVIAIALRFSTLPQLLNRYRALFAVGVIFFIYAVYGNVYWGEQKILVYGVPHFFLTCSFRTNGRFFWPVWYLLLTFATITLINKKTVLASIILPLLLILQLFDVSGYLNTTKANLQTNFTPMETTDPNTVQIANLIRQNHIVIFYPKTGCNMTNEDFNTFLQTELITAKAGVLLNSAYLAHYKSPHCTDDANAFPRLQPKLLISTTSRPSPTIKMLLQTQPHTCKIIAQTYYCEYTHDQ